MSNDRLKFRVWCNEYKEYLPNNQYMITQEGALRHIAVGIPKVTLSCVIEQCTGLCDKNGNLIFEGDLLGDSKEDDEFIEICWCDTLASFMCDIYPETYGNLETCDVEYLAKFEIVGNIHEMEVTK